MTDQLTINESEYDGTKRQTVLTTYETGTIAVQHVEAKSGKIDVQTVMVDSGDLEVVAAAIAAARIKRLQWLASRKTA